MWDFEILLQVLNIDKNTVPTSWNMRSIRIFSFRCSILSLFASWTPHQWNNKKKMPSCQNGQEGTWTTGNTSMWCVQNNHCNSKISGFTVTGKWIKGTFGEIWKRLEVELYFVNYCFTPFILSVDKLTMGFFMNSVCTVTVFVQLGAWPRCIPHHVLYVGSHRFGSCVCGTRF